MRNLLVGAAIFVAGIGVGTALTVTRQSSPPPLKSEALRVDSVPRTGYPAEPATPVAASPSRSPAIASACKEPNAEPSFACIAEHVEIEITTNPTNRFW